MDAVCIVSAIWRGTEEAIVIVMLYDLLAEACIQLGDGVLERGITSVKMPSSVTRQQDACSAWTRPEQGASNRGSARRIFYF